MANPTEPNAPSPSDLDCPAAVQFPKHHVGEELIEIMLANLIANNADPAAIEAKRHARELAMAVEVEPASKPVPFVSN